MIKPPKNAAHSAVTAEHGSPPEFVELAYEVMGGIDLDPASSPAWNRTIRAARIITAEENGLRTPWVAGAPSVLQLRTQPVPGFGERVRVLVNPPGDKRGELVAEFWFGVTEYFRLRWISSAIWIGFNVEQLSRLQRVGAPTSPLREMTLVPSERKNYLDERTGRQQADAPHASFVTLLTRDTRERERFAGLGAALGDVVNGDRR
jgi:hypothetical protein